MIPKARLDHLHTTECEALAEFVQKLQEQLGSLVQSVLLFGSKARGDNTPESDIDVLVVVNSDDWRVRKQISYLATDICLKYDYEFDLSPRIWSVSHLREMEKIGSSLYRNIQRDGISLLEREPGVK